MGENPTGEELVRAAHEAAAAAMAFAATARNLAAPQVSVDGKVDAAAANREQRLLHGLACITTLA